MKLLLHSFAVVRGAYILPPKWQPLFVCFPRSRHRLKTRNQEINPILYITNTCYQYAPSMFSSEFCNRGEQGGVVQSTSLESSPYPVRVSLLCNQLLSMYLYVYNFLVIIIEYRSALHAMTLMGVQQPPLKH